MPTAISIIKSAYKKIGVNDAEVPLQPFEISDGIDELNDMMFEWAARGLKLSYDPVQDQNDETNLPDWSLSGVKSNLGVRLISEFGSPIQPTLIEQARFGLLSIRKRVLGTIETFYPNILPIGGENDQYQDNPRFYPNFARDDLLDEISQSLKTEAGRQIDITGIEDAEKDRI